MNFAEEVGTEIARANIVPKGVNENENHSHRVGQKKSPPKRAKSPKRGGRSHHLRGDSRAGVADTIKGDAGSVFQLMGCTTRRRRSPV